MASYSEYKQQRIVSLWQDGYKAPQIAKLLTEENLPVTRQGVKSVALLVDTKVQGKRQR